MWSLHTMGYYLTMKNEKITATSNDHEKSHKVILTKKM